MCVKTDIELTWASFGGSQGGTCPPPPHTHTHTHFWQWGWQNIWCPPPPPHTHTNKSHISIFIFVLRSFLLDLSGPHILTLYPYSDILSMYSIYRMRGNRNQSLDDIHLSKNYPRTSPTPSVTLRLRRSQLVTPNIFITKFPAPTPHPPPTPPPSSNFFLANAAHAN